MTPYALLLECHNRRYYDSAHGPFFDTAVGIYGDLALRATTLIVFNGGCAGVDSFRFSVLCEVPGNFSGH